MELRQLLAQRLGGRVGIEPQTAIDSGLDREEEVRSELYLVDHHVARELGNEAVGAAERLCPPALLVERHVLRRIAGSYELAYEGALAALSRPDDGYDGRVLKRAAD